MNKWTKLGVTLFAASTLLVACGENSSTEETTSTDNVTEQTTYTQDANTETTKDENEKDSSADENEEKDSADDQDDQADDKNEADSSDDTDQDDEKDSADSSADSSKTASVAGLENEEFDTDLKAAVQTFEDSFADASIHEVSFGYENGKAQYQVEGFDAEKEYEVTIDAETGEILSQAQEPEAETDSDQQEIDFSSVVSPQEAMDAAIASVEGSSVEEWTLHFEDGALVYEVELVDDADQAIDEVVIDAQTAEVIAQDA